MADKQYNRQMWREASTLQIANTSSALPAKIVNGVGWHWQYLDCQCRHAVNSRRDSRHCAEHGALKVASATQMDFVRKVRNAPGGLVAERLGIWQDRTLAAKEFENEAVADA